MVKKRRTPPGVLLIAVTYYTGAAFSILGGLFALSFLVPLSSLLEGVLAFAFYLLLFVGISLVGISILGFYIGLGLQRGKRWARTAAVIFAGFSLLLSLVLIPLEPSSGITSAVIPGLIFWYLTYSKEAKTFFKR